MQTTWAGSSQRLQPPSWDVVIVFTLAAPFWITSANQKKFKKGQQEAASRVEDINAKKKVSMRNVFIPILEHPKIYKCII